MQAIESRVGRLEVLDDERRESERRRPGWVQILGLVLVIVGMAGAVAAASFMSKADGAVLAAHVGSHESTISEQGKVLRVIEVNVARIGERMKIPVERAKEEDR